MAVVGVISEQILIEVKRCNYENPFFIRWRTELGAEYGWLFDGRRVESETSVDNEVTTLNTIGDNYRQYDIEYMTSFDRLLDKDIRPIITLFATDLTRSNQEVLRTLAETKVAQLLLNPTSWNVVSELSGIPYGPRWMDVKVNGSSFRWGRDNNHATLEFEVIKQMKITPRR